MQELARNHPHRTSLAGETPLVSSGKRERGCKRWCGRFRELRQVEWERQRDGAAALGAAVVMEMCDGPSAAPMSHACAERRPWPAARQHRSGLGGPPGTTRPRAPRVGLRWAAAPLVDRAPHCLHAAPPGWRTCHRPQLLGRPAKRSPPHHTELSRAP